MCTLTFGNKIKSVDTVIKYLSSISSVEELHALVEESKNYDMTCYHCPFIVFLPHDQFLKLRENLKFYVNSDYKVDSDKRNAVGTECLRGFFDSISIFKLYDNWHYLHISSLKSLQDVVHFDKCNNCKYPWHGKETSKKNYLKHLSNLQIAAVA